MATGIYNKAQISAIDSMLDTREIYKKVTDLHNDDAFTDVLILGNKKVPTKQPVYYNFVNEGMFKLGDTTGATVTGSGSTTITTKFTAATSGYTRKNDEIKFPDNNVGIVQSVTTASSQDTVVILSVNGTNITHTAGEKLSIFSMAVGENSVAPDNIIYKLSKFSNKYQIFRETSSITDVQGASAIEVEYNGSPMLIAKDHADKTLRLKASVNAAFIGGDMSTTTYSDASPALVDQQSISNVGGGGAVQTTRGLDKYVEAYGKLLTGASLGTYAKSDLDDLSDTLLAVKAPSEQLVIGGDKVMREIHTYFKALGSSGLQSAKLMVDGSEINLNIEKVTYGNFVYNYSPFKMFDSPELFSQTIISKSLYSMPYNHKVKTTDDSGNEKSASAFQIRYVPNQAKFGNDMIAEAHDGALSPVNPNGQVNNWRCTWTTYQGLEVLAPQFMVRQKIHS